MCIFVPKYIWMVDHFISHPAYKSGSYIFFVIYINVWYNIAHVVYLKNNVVFLFFKNQNALHRRKYPLLYGYSFNRFIYNAQKDLRVWLSLVTLSPWGCDKLWSLIVRRCPFYLVLHCSKVSWTVRHYLFMIIHSWGFFFFTFKLLCFIYTKKKSFHFHHLPSKYIFFFFFSNIAFSSHLIWIFCIVFENL